MKLRFTYSLIPALLLAAPVVHGEWLTVADPEDYAIGESDSLLANGWVFQDGDYFAFPSCQDGTNDCTGYRAVVEAPYSPTEGASKAIELRAGHESEALVANARHNLAIELPQHIPTGGVATLFFHFALEDRTGVRWFGVSDLAYVPIGPIVEPGGDQPLGWGDLGPIFSVNQDDQFRVYELNGGGYVNAFEEAGNPDANLAEKEVWYSVWMHIYNDAIVDPADLGGHFELYISGGRFGDTPVHITNTVQAFKDAGITAWTFRRNTGEPIRSFVMMGQHGNPNTNTVGFGATYVNGVYLDVGNITLDKPWGGSATGDTWADWSDDQADNWIDTEGFLGWLYFDESGWIVPQDLGSWIYLPEGNVSASGGWSYIPR